MGFDQKDRLLGTSGTSSIPRDALRSEHVVRQMDLLLRVGEGRRVFGVATAFFGHVGRVLKQYVHLV